MKKSIILFSVVALFAASCTDNSRAKNWGGTEELKLKQNEVLVNMTWKESNLWVQTLDTTTGIQYFREKSSWGWLEGEIVIHPTGKPVIEGVQFER